MTYDPTFGDAGDILEVLDAFAMAYPESAFPVPPPERQAYDGAAAHVMRRMALPWFAEAAREIRRLRYAIDDASRNVQRANDRLTEMKAALR